MIHIPDNTQPPTSPLTVERLTDPEELAAFRAQMARLAKNSAWLQAHAAEVYAHHRGKFIAIAGQQLFVGATMQEAMTQAQAAHPDDDGILTQYIPRERGVRVYADRVLASL
jgi:hypothetical protein